ncbi:hypothetical protein MBLNU230_g6191t1 [Neophaeotheca triangularis]
MAEVAVLDQYEREFLLPFLPLKGQNPTDATPQNDQKAPGLPFVTLTYAQSMDSMIAAAPGERTTLSGMETKSMTHYLRINHAAILVGVGTAVADNPGLNSRYPGTTLAQQPQPIIVDPHGRWNGPETKVEQLARDGKGHRPLWFTSNPRGSDEDAGDRSEGERKQVLVPLGNDGRLDWHDVLCRIKKAGCDSVMVEGGAYIINELLEKPDLVDSVIVTIAPTWLGDGGVCVKPTDRKEAREGMSARSNAATLSKTAWRQFGQDAVVCGRLLRRNQMSA